MKHNRQMIVSILAIVVLSIAVQAKWVQTNGPNSGSIGALFVSGLQIFAGSDHGIFLSTNNGASWTTVNSGLTNTNVECLAASGNNIFAGTNGGGVFLSTNNGTSWTAVNSGLTNNHIGCLAVSGSNIFAATDDIGVFFSPNNGTSWTTVNSGLMNNYVGCLTVNGSNIFAGAGGGGVFLSTNNGTSWNAVNSGLINNYVYSLAVSGSNIFAGTTDGVFLSSNNGATWNAVGLSSHLVTFLTVSGSNIFAGIGSNVDVGIGQVFLSNNNGTNWTAVDSGLPSDNYGVLSLAVSGGMVFAGTGGGVWRRSLSEMVGIINNKPSQGVKPYIGEFKINTNKRSITLLLPRTFNNDAITVRLFTIAGKKIYSNTKREKTGVFDIPVSKFSTGTYLMSITGRNTKYCSSFMLSK